MADLLIKNGNIVTDKGVNLSDILINEGRITKIAPNINSSAEVFDADGMLIFPGFIDMHTHLREPGLEYKEDIESGTRAAINGGFTAVCCMPNTKPPLDNSALIRYVLMRSSEADNATVYPIGCITKGQGGKELADMALMRQAGAIGFSDDGMPVSNGAVMRNAMLYCKSFGGIIISHSEDKSISLDGVVNEGKNALTAGLKGIPSSAESAAIARDILLAEETGARLHICHVSTAASVDIIRAAKARGVNVTAETCPHYICATDDEILEYNTNAKINPPLRTSKDIEALIKGIKDGTIDVIATDHAPHSADEKNSEFDNAPFGTVGLETAFAVCCTFLLNEGHINEYELARLLSENPARILGIEGGKIAEGAVADLAIVDPLRGFTVNSSTFASKGKNSLFEGWELHGKVVQTVKRGRLCL